MILLPDSGLRFAMLEELEEQIKGEEEAEDLLNWIAEAIARHRPDTSCVVVEDRPGGTISVLILWEDRVELVGELTSSKEN